MQQTFSSGDVTFPGILWLHLYVCHMACTHTYNTSREKKLRKPA